MASRWNNVRKKRSAVFTTTEKHDLMDLVEFHYHIIENGKSDQASVNEKRQEWEKIYEQFNASSDRSRDVDSLRCLWTNLKAKANNYRTKLKAEDPSLVKDPLLERVLDCIRLRESGDFSRRLDDTNSRPEVDLKSEGSSMGPEEMQVVADFDEYPGDQKQGEDNHLTIQCDANSLISEGAADRDEMAYSQRKTVPLPLPNRKRPAFPSQIENVSFLGRNRIQNLKRSDQRAEEEHEVQMKILRLQEQQEELKLQQEQLRLVQEKLRMDQEKRKTELEKTRLDLEKKRLELEMSRPELQKPRPY